MAGGWRCVSVPWALAVCWKDGSGGAVVDWQRITGELLVGGTTGARSVGRGCGVEALALDFRCGLPVVNEL